MLIPAPYWPSYPEIVKLAGATPIIMETKAEDGFLVDPEALAKAITPKTRMVRGLYGPPWPCVWSIVGPESDS